MFRISNLVLIITFHFAEIPRDHLLLRQLFVHDRSQSKRQKHFYAFLINDLKI